ncbi:MAG: NAD(P)/FAD-dependent oxidoreductase [Candidatus Rokubacteria bacterium]|nr:NAD(P)/FAD-dependent oxidoreductase [Candidatus Rokubacteria bacterium]
MVRSGRIHRLVRDAARFGTRVGAVELDWAAVVRRQHAIVEELRPAPASLERAGVKVYLGEARFTDPHTLTVDGHRVRGERILIGAGSAPIVPPLPAREAAITSDEILFLPEFPRRLVLVGAGAIGLEMAGAFSDLGADVTVIAQESEILPMFDRDVAAYLRAILEARGVTFLLGATVTGFAGRRGDVTTRFTQAGATHEVRSAEVCLAVGRRWDPRSLGAEALGLETSRLGLKVTPYLRTSLPHIYAAGDAAGNVQLTPVAAYEGRIAARNALEGDRETADVSVVPQTIFTTPEIARVGLTHAAARTRGVDCHVSTHDVRGASNGRATGEDDGYLKLVFEGRTERVVGVQMVSYAAAELIQLAALAIRCGATAELLSTQLSIHPSHAERFIKIAAHDYHEVCEIPQNAG